MSIYRPGVELDTSWDQPVECAVCWVDLTTARVPVRNIETAAGLISVCESHPAGDVRDAVLIAESPLTDVGDDDG